MTSFMRSERSSFIRFITSLAYLHQHGGAESEEVAVFQTDRHYVQGQAAVHEFLGLECDPENAFGQWQQRVLCLMPPFGQYAEGYLVEQHVHALVDDLGVLAHLVRIIFRKRRIFATLGFLKMSARATNTFCLRSMARITSASIRALVWLGA